jgi:KDO2-lipid IV(A) lauroyltransferase
VKVVTQAVADHLAGAIAKHPADWHMLQRMWLNEPRPAAGEPERSEAAT